MLLLPTAIGSLRFTKALQIGLVRIVSLARNKAD
jgi:hypothetical protein